MDLFRKINNLIHFNVRFTQIANQFRFKMSGHKSKYLSYDPSAITVYVTDSCNSSCAFCAQHSPLRPSTNPICFHHPQADMTFEDFKKFISIFKGTLSISFGGFGEPLLNKDIWQMVEWAYKHGYLCSIITNGKVIPENIEFFKNDILRMLCVSVNAPDKHSYTELTGMSAEEYDKVIIGIQAISEARRTHAKHLNLYFSYILNKNTVANAESSILQAIKYGADEVGFHNLLYTGIIRFPDNSVLKENDSDITSLFDNLKHKYSGKIKIIPPKLKPINSAHIKCRDYFRILNIDAAGNVGGCGRLIPPDAKYGNLHKEGRSAWNNEHYRHMRNLSIEHGFAKHPVCSCCMGD